MTEKIVNISEDGFYVLFWNSLTEHQREKLKSVRPGDTFNLYVREDKAVYSFTKEKKDG